MTIDPRLNRIVAAQPYPLFFAILALVTGWFVFVPAGAAAASEGARPKSGGLKVPESSLAKALVWQGIAIEEANFTIWGASPVVAEGKFHLFAARWPEANVDPAWRESSEIAHYVPDQPEGPFRFQSVVVKGTGRTGDWHAFAPPGSTRPPVGTSPAASALSVTY